MRRVDVLRGGTKEIEAVMGTEEGKEHQKQWLGT